jgi:hypothetical protein
MADGDSFWDQLTSGAGSIWDSLNDGSGFEVDDIIKLLGAYGGYEGWFNSDQEKAGYQGKIPDYTAVRDQVPLNTDSSRRPGQSGQRYFSDTTYAQKPDTPIPTVEEANATTAAQIAQLQQQNVSGGGFAKGGVVDAMAAFRGRPQMPQQARTMQQRPPMPQQGNRPFAKGGIVEAMNALKSGGMQNRPPMPPQAQGMPQRPPMPPQAQGMPQRPPMPPKPHANPHRRNGSGRPLTRCASDRRQCPPESGSHHPACSAPYHSGSG